MKLLSVSVLTFAVVLYALLLSTPAATEAGPLHASCKLTWTFQSDCSSVSLALQAAIRVLSTTNCTNAGEKCLYTMGAITDTSIKAVHETPKKHYKG
jgi:hypothetical protein